jgi:hypothetical protein
MITPQLPGQEHCIALQNPSQKHAVDNTAASRLETEHNSNCTYSSDASESVIHTPQMLCHSSRNVICAMACLFLQAHKCQSLHEFAFLRDHANIGQYLFCIGLENPSQKHADDCTAASRLGTLHSPTKTLPEARR